MIQHVGLFFVLKRYILWLYGADGGEGWRGGEKTRTFLNTALFWPTHYNMHYKRLGGLPAGSQRLSSFRAAWASESSGWAYRSSIFVVDQRMILRTVCGAIPSPTARAVAVV